MGSPAPGSDPDLGPDPIQTYLLYVEYLETWIRMAKPPAPPGGIRTVELAQQAT